MFAKLWLVMKNDFIFIIALSVFSLAIALAISFTFSGGWVTEDKHAIYDYQK